MLRGGKAVLTECLCKFAMTWLMYSHKLQHVKLSDKISSTMADATFDSVSPASSSALDPADS